MKKMIVLLFLCIVSNGILANSIIPKIPFTIGALGAGQVVTILVDKNQARDLIPNSLELAKAPGVDNSKHPITLFFLNHKDFFIKLKGKKIGLVKDYNELVVAVNFVKLKNKHTVYTYFQNLYLDKWRPIIGGWYYGYPKKKGKFVRKSNSFIASTTKGELLASIDITKKEAVSSSRNLDFFKEMLKAPVVSNLNSRSKLECSYFNWQDFRGAKIFSIESDVFLSSKLLPTLNGRYYQNGVNQELYGGVEITAGFEVLGPFKCK